MASASQLTEPLDENTTLKNKNEYICSVKSDKFGNSVKVNPRQN